jgi:hypothetical protein
VLNNDDFARVNPLHGLAVARLFAQVESQQSRGPNLAVARNEIADCRAGRARQLDRVLNAANVTQIIVKLVGVARRLFGGEKRLSDFSVPLSDRADRGFDIGAFLSQCDKLVKRVGNAATCRKNYRRTLTDARLDDAGDATKS